TTGTAFVALVFAAAAVTAAREQWPTLLVVSVAVSLAQVGALVLDTDGLQWSRFAVAAMFWALYVGAALGWQLQVAGERLARLTASLVLVSAGFAVLSAAGLLDGSWGRLDREGVVLGISALAYGALSAAFFVRPGARQLSVLLGATGLAVGAIAVADLLSGASLTYAWAAEGALLAWLAWRLGELRFQLVSFAYLALALGHALVFEARPDLLFDANDHPGRGVPTTLALAAAAGGPRRAAPAATVAGLAWLVVTLVKLGLFDAQELDENLRSYSFLAVGGCVLLAGYLFELARRADAPLGPVAVVGSIVPLG